MNPVARGWLPVLLGGAVCALDSQLLLLGPNVLVAAGHVFMVFAVDPWSLRSMITGRYDDADSPEARNARPFLNLRRRQAVDDGS